MRTKTKTLFKTIALIVLVFNAVGAVGCKLNGGPIYDPRSYSIYNPFRLETHPNTDTDKIAKPDIDAPVDIRQPDGGYYDQRKENTSLVQAGHNANGIEQVQYPPIQKTGYHSEQPQPSTLTPTPYGMPTPSYGNTIPQPVTGSGYSQPSASNFPAEVKNDPLGHNPYAASTNVTGYPSSTTYSPQPNYPSSASTYPSTSYQPERAFTPNPQDQGNVNGTVSSPFANPPSQPNTTTPPVFYGASTSNPNGQLPVTNSYNGGGTTPVTSGSYYTPTTY
ncbi:MAG: hypothetical protein LBB88_07495 [Planctomycetaceae bacterium]|jgi:hypothetical protein|nr:hypothetical protein [Planctomycetaceae bacterium]